MPLGLVALAFTSQWLIDPLAEAAFDAPKRLVVLLGGVAILASVGATAIGMALRDLRDRNSNGRWCARWAAILALATLVWAAVSALAAERVGLALDGWRTIALSAPLVALGASRRLDGPAGETVLAAFWCASVVTAVLSLLQVAGWVELFRVAKLGGRDSGVALIGNEGLVGLVMALAATSAMAVWLQPATRSRREQRAAALVVLGTSVGALLGSGNLTGWIALASGMAVLGVLRFGTRALALAALAIGVVVAAAFTVPPLERRVAQTVAAVRHGDWNTVLTYRPVAWRAALEMVRAHPATGIGPGTFEADFVRWRVAAEARLGRRLVSPEYAGHFAAAHDDYLDVLAASGWPGGIGALAATGLLLGGLTRRALRRAADAGTPDVVTQVCLGTLVCGAVAALTWFPMQAAATRVPLLLLAGRGLRLLDDPAGLHPASEKRAGDLLVGRVVLLGLALLALPELPRYLAEHRTYRIRARVEQLSAPRSPPPSPTLVEELGESAVAASRWIPGDTRTLTASAAAALFARDGELALHRYSVALARGERAEVDLNLGRAYALLDRRPEALAAFVRSVWLTPALAGELPEAAKPLVDAEIRRREALLRSGAADAVPPLPRLDEP